MIASQSAGAPAARNRRATTIRQEQLALSLKPMRNNKVMMYTIDRIDPHITDGRADAGAIISNVSWTYLDWSVLNCSLTNVAY